MQFQFGEKALITREMDRIEKGLGNRIPLDSLLAEFAARWQIEEIREFAEVFAIARRSGGNLPEILGRTASLIRDRMEIDTEIDLLLSSRRFEQKIMEGVPFFIIFYLGMSTEGFFDVLYHNPGGVIFMTGCLAAYLAAILLSDRIMAIEL
jgi:tight adherence protein B